MARYTGPKHRLARREGVNLLDKSSQRFMTRQLVSHGHILVNGKRLNIPSYSVKTEDVISLSPNIQKNPRILELLKEDLPLLPFLDKKGISGKLKRMPKHE